MTTFTPHQDSALKAVADWLKAKPGQNGTPPVFRLFGYAGTGKTTLARLLAAQLKPMDGGITGAMMPAEAISPAERALSWPAETIIGSSSAVSAAASATAEPDSADNRQPAMIVT